jgi:pilus assembly protein Flp/PilA
LIEEEEGQTIIEYGLLLMFIAFVVIAILTVMGRKVRDMYTGANTMYKSTA